MAMQDVSRDPVEKERERARIAADVEAFLRRGGVIEQVRTGAMAGQVPITGRAGSPATVLDPDDP